MKLFFDYFEEVLRALLMLLFFAPSWIFWAGLCTFVVREWRLKSGEVIDPAEKMSNCVGCQKHAVDLAFAAAFCLYFRCSVSIMLRDLQDASVVP